MGWKSLFEDDGRGLTMEDIRKSEGIGWRNIQARTELLAGNFVLESPPKGTRMRLLFP